MNKEQKTTQDGQEEKSLEQRHEELSKSVFKMSVMHGNALDMMYLQMITMIEILSDAKLLTPEKWEEKLAEVSSDMEKRIKEKMANEAGDSGQSDENNTDRPDAPKGSGKIITPNSGLIIP